MSCGTGELKERGDRRNHTRYNAGAQLATCDGVLCFCISARKASEALAKQPGNLAGGDVAGEPPAIDRDAELSGAIWIGLVTDPSPHWYESAS
jgi:hypothetical protein